MGDICSLLSVLTSIRGLFDRLAAVEDKKLEAIATNNVDALDELMKSEQALSLELRGLDSKREKVQDTLGYGGMTLRDIISAINGADRDALGHLYAELQERTENLEVAVACTKKFIELQILSIDALLDHYENGRAQDGSYEKTGRHKPEEPGQPHITAKV